MAEVGVAPGEVIVDRQGKNLGANQENLQQSDESSPSLDWIRRCYKPSGSLLRNTSRDPRYDWPHRKGYHWVQELYAKHMQNAGRMYFGHQRTKQLKAMLHWVQDFAQVSEVLTLEGLSQWSSDTWRFDSRPSLRQLLGVVAIRALYPPSVLFRTDRGS